MPRDINTRLSNLRQRRQGLDRLESLDFSEQLEVLAKANLNESWQDRVSTSKPYTRYAVGAMQEVGRRSSEISVEEATRVGKQLKSGLSALGIPVEFELQGSVPLNVHIRGVSDVDLLTLREDFFTYDPTGPFAVLGGYSASTRTSPSVLSELRTNAETVLKSAFPKAKVDIGGGKAINVSGASLRRPVDVVPSHWFNTAAYQRTNLKADRGVTVFDKKTYAVIGNRPFLHIKNVGDRCDGIGGGLRKAIRLCKNVKADADATINLPSFDIAALMYHADMNALYTGRMFELAILAETQRFLDWCWRNQGMAKTFRTPDGLRPIFDSQAKIDGLLALSNEMDDLALQVAREGKPLVGYGRVAPYWPEVGFVLREQYIPGA